MRRCLVVFWVVLSSLSVSWALSSCQIGGDLGGQEGEDYTPPDGGDGGGDTESDVDTDTDADGDGDADGDSDSDSDTDVDSGGSDSGGSDSGGGDSGASDSEDTQDSGDTAGEADSGGTAVDDTGNAEGLVERSRPADESSGIGRWFEALVRFFGAS